MIHISGLQKHYGPRRQRVEVLNGLDLQIEPGAFTTIYGSSGSGKSTLLGIISGLDRRYEGSVCVAGRDLRTQSDAQLAALRGRHIGFLFQSPPFLMHLTAMANIKLAARFAGQPCDTAGLLALLARFDIAPLAQRRPGELSGGQLQRLGLARALVGRPELLLCDEPTGNLDAQNADTVRSDLLRLNRAGHTLLLVTHDRRFAAQSDSVYTLVGGRLEKE